MTPLLSCDSIEVRHAAGARPAVCGVSLHVDSGEVVAIMGPNGAGKTTLMRALAGVLPATADRVELGGVDLRGAPPAARVRAGLALVPEGRHLFGDLTAEDNLRLGAWLAPAREVDARLARVLEELAALRGLRRQLARTLSGGEQQMVAVGRALMSAPRLLLLDEPSLGLAPRVVAAVFDALQARVGAGLAVLVAEAAPERLLQMASRGYVLEAGRVRAEGAAALSGDAALAQAL